LLSKAEQHLVIPAGQSQLTQPLAWMALDLLGLPLASQQMAVPDHAQCRAALRLITDVQEM
jgi:hypothetical protein